MRLFVGMHGLVVWDVMHGVGARRKVVEIRGAGIRLMGWERAQRLSKVHVYVH